MTWTIADVMTSPALCVGRGRSLAATARLMHKRAVTRLPVLDTSGRLVGIVSRHDLLKAFLRSDDSIEREIADELLDETLHIDGRAVDIKVRDGVVVLSGELETKSQVELVVRLAVAFEGVVGVDNWLDFRLDDTHLKPELPDGRRMFSAHEKPHAHR